MRTFKISELELIMAMLNSISTQEPDKLSHAVKRNKSGIKQACIPAHEKNAFINEDIYIDHASTDERGNLIGANISEFVFTPEKRKALNKALSKQRNAFKETQVQFEPYVCNDMSIARINELDSVLIEDLTGFLFPAPSSEDAALLSKAEHSIPA